jgi:hypothetical protein
MNKHGATDDDILKYLASRGTERSRYEKYLNDTWKYIDGGYKAADAIAKAVGTATGFSPIISLSKRSVLPKVDVYATMPLPTINVNEKKVTPYP